MNRSLTYVALSAALLGMGCSNDTNRRGQVMVAVSTDMSIDKDLDEVQILIEREADGTLFTDSFFLFPNERGYFVPGTYAVVSGGDGGDVIRVRLLGRSDGDLRVARETVTSIPRNRIGTLSMPLQWLCDGEHALDEDGNGASNCALNDIGETCNLGRCEDAEVDSSGLDDYDPKAIYGGYESGPEAARNGACFDAISCLSEASRVEIDVSDPDVCTFERSEGIKTLNVGLVVENDGHCNPITGTCYIPLSRSEAFGFVQDGRTVTLPLGVCDRLRDGRVLAIVESGACETKDFAMQTCGVWLGGDGIDADGDEIFDEDDNCPFVANTDQADDDEDGVGDACDTGAPDRDGDGVSDDNDNCPDISNETQANADGDDEGDACDEDDDDDGFPDESDPAPLDPFVPDADQDGLAADDDNCPANANPAQEDADEDGEGDVCDGDDDNDEIADKTDNCPFDANPDQSDCDGDDIGDACDVCDSTIAITSPVGSISQETRVFNLSGNVGSLELDSVTVVTESAASGRRLEQTIPVDGAGLFNRQGLILSAGVNTVTAQYCDCVSDPIEITANVDPATMLVTLTWDQEDADLDLYVYEPDPGEVCYFDAQCRLGQGSPLGGVLDVDKGLSEGFGPENYTLSNEEGDSVVSGDYQVRLHYFEGEPEVNYSLRVLLNENDPETEEVLNFTGSLSDSNRTNAAPSATGDDWADVATITCVSGQDFPECTASAFVGGTGGTVGAGGTTGAGGAGGAAGAGTVCAGCGEFLLGADYADVCSGTSMELLGALTDCGCGQSECQSLCDSTLCTTTPIAPDGNCYECVGFTCDAAYNACADDLTGWRAQ